MTTRRGILSFTALIAASSLVGWEIYRQRPLPKHEDWQHDYESGNIKLVDDWILSATEANNKS